MGTPSPEGLQALLGDDQSRPAERPSGEEGSTPNTGPSSSTITSGAYGAKRVLLGPTDTAPTEQFFCPLRPISDFPSRFVDLNFSKRVYDSFFKDGKFFQREWDLYYVHPPFPEARPLILIPLEQVKSFLSTIQSSIPEYSLGFPPNSFEIGLVAHFPYEPILRPRFLAKSVSLEQYTSYTSPEAVPTTPLNDFGNYPVSITDQAFGSFTLKVAALINISNSRDPYRPYQEKMKLVEKQKGFAQSLVQAQRYLGFRSDNQREAPSFELLEADKDYRVVFDSILRSLELRIVNVDEPCPHPFKDFAFFVSVDVEAWESDDKCLLEIGVSTLDTVDLIGRHPGKHGINWDSLISKHHFIIKEYEHLTNSRFITGCPKEFRFGQSKRISIKDAAVELLRLLNPTRDIPAVERASRYTFPLSAFVSSSDLIPTKRHVVLVGQNIQSDIRYLSKGLGGFDIQRPVIPPGGPQSFPCLETLDIAGMFQVVQRNKDPAKLETMCLDFGITPWFAHNAGNDAAYTMQVLVAVALRPAELTDKILQL